MLHAMCRVVAMVILTLLMVNTAIAQCCVTCFVDVLYDCMYCAGISDNTGGFTCSAGPGCWDCTNSFECYDGGGGCFLGDVDIATPSGSRPISSLLVGDSVLTLGGNDTGQYDVVVAAYVSEAFSYLKINGALKVTKEHPFKVGDDWVVAGDLRVGDFLVGADGAVQVVSIEEVHRGVRVYNISVAGAHTFVAGGVLVHNKPPTPHG